MIRTLALTALFSALVGPAWAASENWIPTSNTAEQFIGPMKFSPERIDFRNGKFVTIAQAGTTPYVDETRAKVNATVCRVTGKGPGGDVLCDGKAAFILVWTSRPLGGDVAPRAINAFKGDRFVMGGPDDCGVFRFDAGRRR